MEMDIKELCRLCSEYSANKLKLKLERYDLKDKLEIGWNKTSVGIQQIERSINNYEVKNTEIESKIKEVTYISFNWL